MRLSILFVCVALIGCTRQTPQTNTGYDVSGSGGGAEVKVVVIEDGTKCAVLVGYQKGAISCDWDGNRK